MTDGSIHIGTVTNRKEHIPSSSLSVFLQHMLLVSEGKCRLQGPNHTFTNKSVENVGWELKENFSEFQVRTILVYSQEYGKVKKKSKGRFLDGHCEVSGAPPLTFF